MSHINTQFGDCNIVMVNSSHMDFTPVLGTPLTKYSSWQVGSLSSFSTSHPNATITTLPMPEGRMPNRSLQNAILKCADVFILSLDTTDIWSGEDWMDTLSKFEVPVLCWVDRSREEQCIQAYKKQTMKSLLRQYKTQTKLEVSRNDENSSAVNKDARSLYSYTPSWPVKDYDTLVNEIKISLGADTPIFGFDPTDLTQSEKERTWKENRLVTHSRTF